MIEILERLRMAYQNRAGLALTPLDVRDLAQELELFRPRVDADCSRNRSAIGTMPESASPDGRLNR
jgi:hypothetical protein